MARVTRKTLSQLHPLSPSLTLSIRVAPQMRRAVIDRVEAFITLSFHKSCARLEKISVGERGSLSVCLMG